MQVKEAEAVVKAPTANMKTEKERAGFFRVFRVFIFLPFGPKIGFPYTREHMLVNASFSVHHS